jgi:hypothetical protein
MKKTIFISLIFIIITAGKIFSQVPEFCLTKDEYRLYSLINEYRAKNGLGIIPVSRSLCYVAKIHARDLFMNNPDTAFCSLNSWSNKGKWTACCHSAFTPSPACIVNKPKELAKYSGEGHEIAYWGNENLYPDTIMYFWKSTEITRELLLNQKKWSYFTWKAVGVGLYKGYACVWVGDVMDTIPEPSLCANTPGADNLPVPFKTFEKVIISNPTGRYYIIYGSFITEDDAVRMTEKYQKEGFSMAKVLVSEEKTFRVSLNDFATQQEALDAKKKLGNGYKEAWITKY